jgi:hypothetical protein
VLDNLGSHAEAAALLAGLIARQDDDHLWIEDGDHWVPAASVLMAFARHFDLTNDKAWLEANYRPLLSAAEAILEARQLTKWVANDPDDPIYGLMPSAAYGDVPWDDCLAQAFSCELGVLAVSCLARNLGKTSDYLWLEDNLRDMLACSSRACKTRRGPQGEMPKESNTLAGDAATHAGQLIPMIAQTRSPEDGIELHLLLGLPREYLAKDVVVTNLPTVCGPLSFKASLADGGRKLVVDLNWKPRRAPKAIVVHPPLPAGRAKSVRLDGWRGGPIELTLE